jgi:hypothetical protein
MSRRIAREGCGTRTWQGTVVSPGGGILVDLLRELRCVWGSGRATEVGSGAICATVISVQVWRANHRPWPRRKLKSANVWILERTDG